MKVEVSKTTKKFEPITLTITIESKDELLDMYVRNKLSNRVLVGHVIKNYPSVYRGVSKEEYVQAVESISEDTPEILRCLRPLVEALP